LEGGWGWWHAARRGGGQEGGGGAGARHRSGAGAAGAPCVPAAHPHPALLLLLDPTHPPLISTVCRKGREGGRVGVPWRRGKMSPKASVKASMFGSSWLPSRKNSSIFGVWRRWRWRGMVCACTIGQQREQNVREERERERAYALVGGVKFYLAWLLLKAPRRVLVVVGPQLELRGEGGVESARSEEARGGLTRCLAEGSSHRRFMAWVSGFPPWQAASPTRSRRPLMLQ